MADGEVTEQVNVTPRKPSLFYFREDQLMGAVGLMERVCMYVRSWWSSLDDLRAEEEALLAQITSDDGRMVKIALKYKTTAGCQ
ncbi:hypothetical protein [Flavobacterium sp.]|uniref:hypothetical protein n=1 Tax=Flavobacterium sp. TaxID=239 RepID=UPI002605F8C5|nr:hypothetical protein [Flavobacterium sp.]